MKTFLYGRYDVLRGERGYEVFRHDRAIPRETIREMTPLFSSMDPDYRINQVLGGFYVYFPLADGQWVFGKGDTEDRGNYYSYILHGVLLDEDERRILGYNPFLLADDLNPQIGDRRELPAFPDQPPNTAREWLHAWQAYQMKRCTETRKGRHLLHVAGEMVYRILEKNIRHGEPKAEPGGNPFLIYAYDKDVGAPFWSLVYQMTPEVIRKQLSLSTLTAFLKKDTALRGSFENERQTPKGGIRLVLDRVMRTDFGNFLEHWSHTGDDAQRGFAILDAAHHDAEFLARSQRLNASEFNAFFLAYTRGLIKGMEKPSYSALNQWPHTPAHEHLFPIKIASLIQIWEQNHTEEKVFADLAVKILREAIKDYGRLYAARRPSEKLEDDLVKLVMAIDISRDATLKNMVLTADLPPDLQQLLVGDEAMVASLFEIKPEREEFQNALSQRLKAKKDWPAELDPLLGHVHFNHCDPKLHATIFERFGRRSTRFLFQRLLAHRYRHDPGAFTAFFEHLSPGLRGRCLVALRLCLLETESHHEHICNEYLQCLEICRKVDEITFAKSIRPWINQRELDWLVPTLARAPHFLEYLADLWRHNLEDELSLLRLCHIMKILDKKSGLDPADKQYRDKQIKSHKLFETLLGIS